MTDKHSSPAYLATTPLGASPTVTHAVAAFAEHTDTAGAVGFAYTPTAALWFTHTDNGWRTHSGDGLPPTVFELRAFTPSAELRWWRDADADTGAAVVLTETAGPPTSDPIDHVVRLQKRSMLLWGSVIDVRDRWANLADPRIGDILWLPLPEATVGSTARLHLVEYVSTDAHGNVAVTEQRLTRLTHTSATADSGRHT